MKSATILALLPLLAACSSARSEPAPALTHEDGEFNPPDVLLLSEPELERLRERVAADPAARSAFARVRAEADAALDDDPRPLRQIVYEGHVSHHPERLRTIAHLQDMRKLRALGWAYAITRDPRYARAGKRFIDAWTEAYEPTGNPINDNQLSDIFLAYHLLRPELGRDAEVEQWMRELAREIIRDSPEDAKGNWHAGRLKLVALAGASLGDRELVDYARRGVVDYVAGSFNPDGTTWDFHHRDAIHYHLSGVGSTLELALILRPTGFDLYRHEAPNGGSLRRSVEWVIPYARGEKVHPEWVNTRVELDRKRWESGDEHYRPGRPWDPMQSLDTFATAAIFDPSLREIVQLLRTRADGSISGSWQNVVVDVLSGGTVAEASLAAAPPPDEAVEAARRFLGLLGPEERTLSRIALADPSRMEWFYTPVPRKGLTLKRMNDAQRRATHELVGTGLSPAGVAKARAIIELENTLRDLELAAGRADAITRRDPGLYYLSIFGTPSPDSAWGWRFEGHHLSVNATVIGDDAQVVAPLFMGANPARVPSGPQEGLRILDEEEDFARELLAMLTPQQRARAIVSDTTYGDIRTRNDPVAPGLPVEGLAASEMNAAQQRQLRRLLELYAGRLNEAEARDQLTRMESAGFGNLHFVWAGGTQPRERHYYRVQGPTLLIEYDNTQNDANHVHTVWRDPARDFGGDLLKEHYRRHRH